ncbi:hypothetical protein QUF49_12065 [Fictibacillus sp. b24]|uniref:hypothetical protein n=1 Tax=Fictibacillus sp. b24 TaxID=3055863 RepID=UPI0025A2B069|nr:hypothetical protein [Fictibacillus sp. b24]MDM5316733.1 hypothetical protein [Fictibacillus sp. b24]
MKRRIIANLLALALANMNLATSMNLHLVLAPALVLVPAPAPAAAAFTIRGLKQSRMNFWALLLKECSFFLKTNNLEGKGNRKRNR